MATCTKKAICEGCKKAYGEIVAHNITKYGGKDSTGHWDTCSTCNNKFNFEEHTPDREFPDETNPVKCKKCGLLIAPVKQSKGLSEKAIAGIIIGSVAVVVLGGFVIWLRLRKCRCRIK